MVYAPHWSQSEVERTKEVLISRKNYLRECRTSLTDVENIKRKLESDLKASRTILNYQQLVHAQTKIELDSIEERVLALTNESKPLASDGSQLQGVVVLERLKSLENDRLMEENAQNRALKMVTDCEADCHRIQDLFEERSQFLVYQRKTLGLVHKEVAALESHNERMIQGSGSATYFSPLLSPSDPPATKIMILNAYPSCGLWFHCANHLPAPCGHSYHPWCIQEHAKTSSCCLLPQCEAPFNADWLAAWGIHTVVLDADRESTPSATNLLQALPTTALDFRGSTSPSLHQPQQHLALSAQRIKVQLSSYRVVGTVQFAQIVKRPLSHVLFA